MLFVSFLFKFILKVYGSSPLQISLAVISTKMKNRNIGQAFSISYKLAVTKQ